MKQIIRLSIAILLLCFASVGVAKEVKFYNPSFDCSKVKKGSIEYQICTNRRLSSLDNQLNSVYISLLKLLENKTRNLIKTQQRKWIQKRNKCILKKGDEEQIDCTEYSISYRIKNLQKHYPIEKLVTKDFKFRGNYIHPGCIYELLPDLNGDYIVRSVFLGGFHGISYLRGCSYRNNKYNILPEKIVYGSPRDIGIIKGLMQVGDSYISSYVDNNSYFIAYKLEDYLGDGRYKLKVLEGPVKGRLVTLNELVFQVTYNKKHKYYSMTCDYPCSSENLWK